MTQKQVEETLLTILKQAEDQGKASITIVSGELNKLLPYTAETSHSYSHMCCNAMNKFFNKDTDRLIKTSDSGQTSQHIIEYALPRNQIIDDEELLDLEGDISFTEKDFEEEYNRNYPKKFVSEISITVEEWKKLLIKEDNSIFHESDIELLKKIFVYPHHAVTCKELSDSEGKTPQAYNKPVVALARRIQKEMNLSPIYRDNGKEVFWRILFWGQELSNTLFEWKIRPELAEAMKQLWPELDLENVNQQEDARYVRDVTTSSLQELPEFKEYIGKPRKKAEKILVAGRMVYPRDRKVAFNALSKSGCKCEYDNSHKSFICKSSRRIYLEQHHLIPLNFADDFEYSIDIEENVVSLCSNCHNEIHYGADSERIIKKLFEERKDALSKAGIKVTEDWIINVYK